MIKASRSADPGDPKSITMNNLAPTLAGLMAYSGFYQAAVSGNST
jgi:hypothetical protein